jgi:iron complex outermembrane recepter protein
MGAAAAGAAETSPLLEEIIVTAERRSESILEVPLSITAYDDELRDRIGIITIQDMANFAPGVSYNTAVDRPTIRGIGRQSNSFSLDSPVANYFDGVYTTSVQDAQRRPIFIERTEILRGPQGALSGRGSIAGAVNTVSKRPQETFGGEVRFATANYDRMNLDATLTGPITDWLRARVNLAGNRQDEGYFDNLARLGETEGDQPNNRESIDVLLEADLGESVDLFIKVGLVDYDETRRSTASLAPYVAGVQNNPTAYGPGTATLVPLASWGYFDPTSTILSGRRQNPVLTTGNVYNFVSDFESRQQLDNHHNYTAHLTWHTGFADLKWIGGHQNYKYTQWTDVDGDVTSMRLPGPAARVVYPGIQNLYQEEREWYSNELTLTSTTEGAFSWIAGLYQSNEQYVQTPQATYYRGYPELNQPFGTVAQLLAFLGGAPAPTVRPAANVSPFRSSFGNLDGETISTAAFFQVDFAPTDQWKFTAGLRYNKDEKEVTERARFIANGLGNGLGGFLAGGNTPLGPLSVDVTPVPAANAVLPPGVIRDRGIDPATGYRVRDLKDEWDAVTGSAGVDFSPTENDLIFFRFARGYRSGGFNAGFISDPPTVDKESVDSFEIGYKTLLASRLQLSSSVFYYNYKDIQLPLPTLGRCTDPNNLSSCQVLNSFINLPKGETKGVEVELSWAATDALNLYLSYGYLDAKIKDGLSTGGNGFSNPDDPAAVLPGSNRYQAIPNQFDTDFTFLQRYTQDLSGNSLANSPKNKAAFNANYTVALAAGSLVLSANYVWRDEMFSDVFETPHAIVPSFDTVAARVQWTDASDRYTLTLYGSNLTDEEVNENVLLTRQRTGLATAGNPGAQGQAYYKTLSLLTPREYGFEVQYRFGK